MSMNRYDEVTGMPLQTESPKKDFGVPLPGEPSIAYTLEKNQLAEIYARFNGTVQMLGQHAEARDLIENGPLGQMTGQFNPSIAVEMVDPQLRSATMPAAASGTTDGYNYGRVALGVDVDIANARSNNSTQPIQIHTFQGTPQANNGNITDFNYDYSQLA